MIDPVIASALATLPSSLTGRAGSVFYSGPSAFRGKRDLYVLGLNPGGDPARHASSTIARHLGEWRCRTDRWSAYVNDLWEGDVPGGWGMQPRMRHMFDRLDRDLADTPASNVVFVRSATEARLGAERGELLPLCWSVHRAVIEALGVTTVLALGQTAGRWCRGQLGAHEEVGRFREINKRRWTRTAHRASDGRVVVTVTHPGRADWRNPDADPTPLVAAMLGR